MVTYFLQVSNERPEGRAAGIGAGCDSRTAEGPRVIRLQNIGFGEFVDEEAHISRDHALAP